MNQLVILMRDVYGEDRPYSFGTCAIPSEMEVADFHHEVKAIVRELEEELTDNQFVEEHTEEIEESVLRILEQRGYQLVPTPEQIVI